MFLSFAPGLLLSALLVALFGGEQVGFGAPVDQPGPQAADAAAKQEAKAALARGAASLNAGRDREAIADLRAAYEVLHLPRILLLLAVAHQNLKEFDSAKQYWEQCHSQLRPDDPLQLDVTSGLEVTKAGLREQQAKREAAEISKTNTELARKLQAKRPRWRLGLGAGLTAAGGALLGFGIPPLAIDGRCINSPALANAACTTVYDTKTLGATLTAAGAGLALAGVFMMAWPPAGESAPRRATNTDYQRGMLALKGTTP